MSNQDNADSHWQATRKLTFISLGIWAFFSFFVHMLAPWLNNIVIFGFPMGYYMAAQGSLIVFVALIFWFCAQQEKIDRDHGVSED